MAPPAQLPSRPLGKNGPQIPRIGFGAMGLSLAYGQPGTEAESLAVLDRAWELGATHWDTADVYGNCEEIIGKWFALHPERRADIFLATKFALSYTQEGLGVNTTPEYCLAAAESSLKRLGVDYIDLYYIHRVRQDVPIEKTITAMAKLVKEGKVRHLGISECSSQTLRRAYAVHPISAVQIEYNPWDLAIEGPEGTNLLQTCRELGVATVAYSPFSRGLLTGAIKSRADMDPTDFRINMPRYSEENLPKNLELVAQFDAIAKEKGCTASQLVLAWLLAQGDDIFPIPGTRRIKFLEENVGASFVTLTEEEEKRIRQHVDKANIQGDRGAILTAFADTDEL